MSFVTRPSSLPAQAKSPRWESAGSTAITEAGNDRHTALEELLVGKRSVFDLLPEHEQAAVQWAADYIKTNADGPIFSEQALEIKRGGVVVLRGTADAIGGRHLFDLKWVERNYSQQMAAYALGVMQTFGHSSITVHVLFGETQRVQRYPLSMAEAEALVYPVLDEVANPNVQCRASEYCGWCKHQATCPVILGHVGKVGDAYEMVRLDDFHLASVDQVAAALNLAKVAEEWADAIKSKARDLALSGIRIPGYEIKERSGAREIAPENINQAFERLQMPPEVFLRACKVSITKLVEELTTNGLTKKAANQAVNDRLLGLVETKPAVKYLSKIK